MSRICKQARRIALQFSCDGKNVVWVANTDVKWKIFPRTDEKQWNMPACVRRSREAVQIICMLLEPMMRWRLVMYYRNMIHRQCRLKSPWMWLLDGYNGNYFRIQWDVFDWEAFLRSCVGSMSSFVVRKRDICISGKHDSVHCGFKRWTRLRRWPARYTTMLLVT